MKKLFLIILTLILIPILTSCEKIETYSKYYNVYFDTTFEVILETKNKEKKNNMNMYFLEVENILSKYHKLFDRYNSYENIVNIYSINHRSTDTLRISTELFETIKYVLENEKETKVDSEYLFNIALGRVLELWHDARDICGYDEIFGESTGSCLAPDSELLFENYSLNPDDIVLNEEDLTITLPQGMTLDLGGVGKGYVAELITKYLDNLDVSYYLNAGTSNLKYHYEGKEKNKFIRVKITDPTSNYLDSGSDRYYATLKLPSDKVIITSGDYQRYYYDEVTHALYHHIIDPRTRFPGNNGIRSVTIIGDDGAIGDIYSTSVFLMTIEQGLDFINNLENYEAIWYASDGKIYKSNGMDKYIIEIKK